MGDHGDEFGHPVTQVDVVNAEFREPGYHLVAGDHGAAGGNNAFRGRIPLRKWEGGDHVLHDHVGGLKPENGGVAGVELENAMPVKL